MALTVETKTRKWGNSLGIVLPKELVDKEHLYENEKVRVFVVREHTLADSFGALKGKLKMTGQEFKDMVRKGWD